MAKYLTMGVETSCDETSVAIVEDGTKVLSNIISSQIETHQPFGGVVPEIASRKHLESITPVVQKALDDAGVGFQDINIIAVTYGPGLVGALLVGVSVAKAMAYALDIPLIGVNHLEGHVYASFLEHKFDFPVLCLVVSGGHTSLLHLKGHGDKELLGQTRDDAAGEAFDKIARYLGLGYPGGPAIEKEAQKGNPQAIEFPRAWLEKDSLDFSFSGLKSAVINYVHNAKQKGQEVNRADVAASFQQAVVDVLVEKTAVAARKVGTDTVILAGGVAANSSLREQLTARLKEEGKTVFFPSPVYCTDNAAMIACAGYFRYKRGEVSDLYLNAVPGLPFC
ncbi:MAG: tRNA N6-adenosine threonylcarbamoyltransferase [Clostridia bacterium]|jgi:N6-L-threonylcarbamoyladenine synthase|nr:O-sialoglycoprotein endopeptidase [Clostridiales bacterium]MDK2984792.1 tRNA N6-adenosine threonylcarbamoyltransferase [Clostridia bacterium]